MKPADAKKYFGKNFIGPQELEKIRRHLKIRGFSGKPIPAIPFDDRTLKTAAKDHVLIYAVSRDLAGRRLTLNRMRDIFGFDPKKREPCFYNQDWYLRERFAAFVTAREGWHLVRKNVVANTRAKSPEKFAKRLALPSAVLSAFTFFSYFFHTKGETLWKHDFIWCSDFDANRDQIYVGRYFDPKGLNKNGFNIHRHLRIKRNYGVAPEITTR